MIPRNQFHQRVLEEHRNLNGGWGGTLDPAIRAFDDETGHELWQGKLPAGARSTPMTYKGPDGKQYVVLSAGAWGIPQSASVGGYLVAFSL